MDRVPDADAPPYIEPLTGAAAGGVSDPAEHTYGAGQGKNPQMGQGQEKNP